jgi:hypothetical protein
MTVIAGLLLSAVLAQGTPDDLKRHVYRLAPAMTCPPVVVDVSDFPEGKAWGEAAKAVVQEWYGPITQLLATDGRDVITGEKKGKPFDAPKTITIVIKKTIDPPAYASGGTITVNGKWITQHPEDLGMMVHELTHVIQQYPGSRTTPGWLVEGVADYIRWWRYEPELHATSGRTKINFEKAKFTDSYRTTGMWLAWASRKYNMSLVPALDKAMRDREDPMPVFQKLTGKSAQELWDEFAKTY